MYNHSAAERWSERLACQLIASDYCTEQTQRVNEQYIGTRFDMKENYVYAAFDLPHHAVTNFVE